MEVGGSIVVHQVFNRRARHNRIQICPHIIVVIFGDELHKQERVEELTSTLSLFPEKEHVLDFSNLPNHTHGGYIDVGFSAHPTGNTNEWKQYLLNTRLAPNGTVNIQTNGVFAFSGVSPFNLMNPYHVCYIWRRVA